MLKWDFKLKFFDSRGVLRAVDQARRRALLRGGALIRTIARRSIRKRKKASTPGQPPSSHEGSLRRLIMFGYDRSAVVIGPVGFKRSEAPQALEHGGRTTVTRYRRGKQQVRKVRIKERPFMGPAATKARPQLPRQWANSIR